MDFYKRMSVVLLSVPEGKVITYGQTAKLIGRPRNARQVGYGLREGLGGDVPAYKVVNSKGFLSGANHFLTWDMQRTMLMNEGIIPLMTNEGWRVDLEKYGWKLTAEEAEKINKIFEAKGI
ncbi:MAG: MGMT family protein [Clostridiales bacterium]|nr:MGMT family protein [Clostridiales bacterium]